MPSDNDDVDALTAKGQSDVYYRPETDRIDNPETIAARHMLEKEHLHLAENSISIGYLMCREPKRHQGRGIAGAVHVPTVQGKLKDLFEMLLGKYFGDMPHFLMIIDEVWWDEHTGIQREALIWHELCHIQQEIGQFGEPRFTMDGLPKYELREHDVTAFNSEVARFGAWSEDLQQFKIAINQK